MTAHATRLLYGDAMRFLELDEGVISQRRVCQAGSPYAWTMPLAYRDRASGATMVVLLQNRVMDSSSRYWERMRPLEPREKVRPAD